MAISKNKVLSRPRYALALLVFVYPVVTFVSHVIGVFGPELSLWLRSALLCPLVVATVVWVIIPFVQHYLSSFIYTSNGADRMSG